MSAYEDNIRFQIAVNRTFEHEGGYVDDPDDAGGATNYGISLKFLKKIDKKATVEKIKKLTKEEAAEIYYNHFWKPQRCDEFDLAIGAKLFDVTVNMGALNATKALQRAVRSVKASKVIKVDGRLGDKTEFAVKDCDPSILLAAFRSEIAAQYRMMALARPQNLKFLKGWLNRAYS